MTKIQEIGLYHLYLTLIQQHSNSKNTISRREDCISVCDDMLMKRCKIPSIFRIGYAISDKIKGRIRTEKSKWLPEHINGRKKIIRILFDILDKRNFSESQFMDFITKYAIYIDIECLFKNQKGKQDIKFATKINTELTKMQRNYFTLDEYKSKYKKSRYKINIDDKILMDHILNQEKVQEIIKSGII